MAPNAPIDVDVEKSSSKNTLTWANGGDNGAAVEYYQVEKENDTGDDWELFKDNIAETKLILGDYSLTEGETYNFRVRAKNSVDFGPYSAGQSVTLDFAPSQPLNLDVKADSVTKTGFTLTWEQPSNLGTGDALLNYKLYTMEDGVETLY